MPRSKKQEDAEATEVLDPEATNVDSASGAGSDSSADADVPDSGVSDSVSTGTTALEVDSADGPGLDYLDPGYTDIPVRVVVETSLNSMARFTLDMMGSEYDAILSDFFDNSVGAFGFTVPGQGFRVFPRHVINCVYMKNVQQ